MSSTNHNKGVPDTSEHINAISIQVLIQGRDPLPEVMQNEGVIKGLVIKYTYTKPIHIYTLNSTYNEKKICRNFASL